ncbi:MAG: DUF4286 family protein [Crocinitomicaceae bacterium]
MIIYNVTVNIDEDVHDEWLEWMRKTHIPDVMATGLFLESKIAKVHSEDDHFSYAISYLCLDKHTLQQYHDIFAPKLQREHAAKFEGKFAAFRTFLDVIESF